MFHEVSQKTKWVKYGEIIKMCESLLCIILQGKVGGLGIKLLA